MCGGLNLLTCICVSHVFGLVFSGAPVLDPISQTVAVVLQYEKKQTTLVTGITCTDPDGDPTRIRLTSVSPGSPCGNCFQVWPCLVGTGYCLMFLPSVGTLSLNRVSSYFLQVSCTDDIDPAVSTSLVEVRLKANSPPTFTDPVGGGSVTVDVKPTNTKGTGDLIYDVNADDVDGDPVFYSMATTTNTDLFEIGYASGQITATKDLRLLCEDSITYLVSIADPYHSPSGQAIVQAFFLKRNERPVVTNKKTVITVAENTAASVRIRATDANGDSLLYKMRALPERGLEYYQIDTKGLITSRKNLDYEYADLRSVTLYVDVTDGFCDAATFSLTMEITDVNEDPVITPIHVEKTVYEGFVSLDPGWTLTDPDVPESHVWSSVTGGGGKFVVDTSSGFVHSMGEVDIDPRPEQKYSLKVQVHDKDGATATATIKITVLDKNDNVPIFARKLYSVTASPCTKTGAIIETINANDLDSEFQGNNLLVYSGTGSNITVLSTGDVTLLTPCVVGQTETIEGYVTDMGEYPGPLSAVPTTISFSCNECPVPVPSVTTPNLTTVTGADLANREDWLSLNLGWIIPAVLLAMLLASLLAYVIWRYCTRAWATWRARALSRSTPRPRTVGSKPETPKKEKPATQKKPPRPPVPPTPEPEPFLFGFWKEINQYSYIRTSAYPDRDQRHTPKRDVKPASVEEDKKVEEKERQEEEKEKEQRRLERQKATEKYQQELDTYHQELNGTAKPAPPKKKRFCSIL